MPSNRFWKRLRRASKAALLLILLLSLTGVIYIAVEQPSTNEPYTEFYTLGSSGNASDYPNNLTVEERGELIVGVSNQEGEDITYSIKLTTNSSTLASDEMTVPEEQTREQSMSFNIKEPGRHRVYIELYKRQSPDPAADPYQRLWLWVEVLESDTTGG